MGGFLWTGSSPGLAALNPCGAASNLYNEEIAMASQPSQFKQNDAKKLFRAALDAGYEVARVIFHPDGRIEASASFVDPAKDPNSENSFDRLLK
jgi:hypothetical protein